MVAASHTEGNFEFDIFSHGKGTSFTSKNIFPLETTGKGKVQ